MVDSFSAVAAPKKMLCSKINTLSHGIVTVAVTGPMMLIAGNLLETTGEKKTGDDQEIKSIKKS